MTHSASKMNDAPKTKLVAISADLHALYKTRAAQQGKKLNEIIDEKLRDGTSEPEPLVALPDPETLVAH